MDVGLTSSQLAARKGRIGASDANVIMSGDSQKIMQLWREKRGEAEREDLSNVLAVVMGQWTEELNRLWFTRQTGRVVHSAGNEEVHTKHPFIACTLDGLTMTEHTSRTAVFEAKHVNPFSYERAMIVARYQPQMQHQMMVTNLTHCVLSVLIGTMKWECTDVPADLFYQATLLEHELQFWECVQTGQAPHLSYVAPPAPIAKYRDVDMTGRNEWAEHAHQWRSTAEAAQRFTEAASGLKAMVERDVGIARGHGVLIKRDGRGLTISGYGGEE